MKVRRAFSFYTHLLYDHIVIVFYIENKIN